MIAIRRSGSVFLGHYRLMVVKCRAFRQTSMGSLVGLLTV